MAAVELQSERVTFLATPALKERLANLAKESGLSIGEYVRRRVQDTDGDDLTAQQEQELAALVEQVNDAIPRMNASLASMSETIRALRAENDAFFREKGIR